MMNENKDVKVCQMPSGLVYGLVCGNPVAPGDKYCQSCLELRELVFKYEVRGGLL